MAVAALRNLVTKIRIPGPSTLRALRAPGPQAQAIAPLPPPPPPPKGDLEIALQLKDKIESAGAKELMTSGDMIAEHCEQVEEVVSMASEIHAQVSRSVRDVALRCFFTGVVLGSIQQSIEGYYYMKDEYEAEVRRLEAEFAVAEAHLAAKEVISKEVCHSVEELAVEEGRLAAVGGLEVE